VGLESDESTTGFGATHHLATVNYYRLFKRLDVDGDKFVDMDEFNRVKNRKKQTSSRNSSGRERERWRRAVQAPSHLV
jgi:hypothetical protein